MSIVDRKDQAEIFDLNLSENSVVASGSHLGKCTIKNKTTPCKIIVAENKQSLKIMLIGETIKLKNTFNLNDATKHSLEGNAKEVVSWSKKKNKEDYIKLKVSKNNTILDGQLELRDRRGFKSKVYFTR